MFFPHTVMASRKINEYMAVLCFMACSFDYFDRLGGNMDMRGHNYIGFQFELVKLADGDGWPIPTIVEG